MSEQPYPHWSSRTNAVGFDVDEPWIEGDFVMAIESGFGVRNGRAQRIGKAHGVAVELS